LKVIILEDNLTYALDYEMILEKLDIKVLGVFKSIQPALKSLRKQRPDFMIVDLLLDNNEKGLDFIEEIKSYRIPFIICTGYPERNFMDAALKLGAEAFFSKPLDKAALSYEIIKLRNRLEEESGSGKSILVKYKKSLIKIPQKSIRRIETEGNYSYVYVDDDRKYIVKISLKNLLGTLDKNQFIQCHRSNIVNISRITSLNSYDRTLTLRSGERIELGSKYKSGVKEAFMKLNPSEDES